METEHKHMERRHWCCSPWKWMGWILLCIVGFVAFLVLAGFVIMGLWNWIMPALFSLPIITFWQALGIALLARLIFGHSPRGGWRHWRRGHRGHAHGRGYECSCNCNSNSDKCCSDGNSHKHAHDHSDTSCDCNSPKWQYYDQYWVEEGEKAFQEYVKRKTENPDATK
jgi:hypothetical protein